MIMCRGGRGETIGRRSRLTRGQKPKMRATLLALARIRFAPLCASVSGCPLTSVGSVLPHRKRAELRASVYHITYEREALLRGAKQFGTTKRRFPLEAPRAHASG